MKNNIKRLNLIILAAFIILSAAGYNFLKYFGAKLDRSSKEFVDTVVVEISEGWEINTFLKYASPDLLKNVDKDSLRKAFDLFRSLGKIQKYKGSEGESKVTFRLREFKVYTTAMYSAKVDFSEGPGKVLVSLVYDDNQWLIGSFNIDSKLFLNQM